MEKTPTKEIILRQTNDLLRDQKLPEIEKVRAKFIPTGGNWRKCAEINVWVKGIANHFSCLFEKSSGEKNIDFTSQVPLFMLKPLRESLKILSDKAEKEIGQDFDTWENIPEK